MKPAIYAASSILFLALSVGEVPPAPQVAGPGSRLAWDFSGLDESGGPEQLASFELADVATGAYVTIPACAALLSALSLAPGTHSLRVRAVDLAGNRSDWSAPLSIVLDNVSPAAPTGCRLLR